ncbi:MAG: Coenzyme F420 hydrogenase/dehydrogenase, beta subunit C-terminal domain [Rhodospirillales bacterium]
MHCGACVGLHPDLLEFEDTDRGPLPRPVRSLGGGGDQSLAAAWAVCPGRGVPFAEVFDHLGRSVENPLLGPCEGIFTGYAGDEAIRNRAASGGVISRVLIHLLQSGRVKGAVVLRQGRPDPETAEPVIATSVEEILAAAQSIYVVTPLLTIIPEMERFDGDLAFVGLSEHVAALRMLQAGGHPAAAKVKFVIGPYTGTNMYKGAVRSFLRNKGVPEDEGITSLQWRAGEWPGYLEARTESGRVLRAEKFYYNYLIPFYISRNCLITPDFTNELTDLSVGDAWSPVLERARGGHSVIIARNETALEILDELRRSGDLSLTPTAVEEALDMHGHMLDFKKRGTFLRLRQQRRKGLPVPDYGYEPTDIALPRRMVETIIGFIFYIGGLRLARSLVRYVPVSILGPVFNVLRQAWKGLSKPAKRRGLAHAAFANWRCPERWREITGVRFPAGE